MSYRCHPGSLVASHFYPYPHLLWPGFHLQLLLQITGINCNEASALSWMGSGRPADYPWIGTIYLNGRKALGGNQNTHRNFRRFQVLRKSLETLECESHQGLELCKRPCFGKIVRNLFLSKSLENPEAGNWGWKSRMTYYGHSVSVMPELAL